MAGKLLNGRHGDLILNKAHQGFGILSHLFGRISASGLLKFSDMAWCAYLNGCGIVCVEGGQYTAHSLSILRYILLTVLSTCHSQHMIDVLCSQIYDYILLIHVTKQRISSH